MKPHGIIIYQYGDDYYVPSKGVVRDGPTVDLAPVERVHIGDVERLAQVIAAKVIEPKTEVDQMDWSVTPVVVAAAGASGWRNLANNGRAWSVAPRAEHVSLYRIRLATGKNDPGGAELLRQEPTWSAELATSFADEIERNRIATTKGKIRMPKWALYWCETNEHTEDCLVTAPSERAAAAFFEKAEGFGRGDCRAERVALAPVGYRDVVTGYANDEDIVACGGELLPVPPAHDDSVAERRALAGVVRKMVRLGDRVFDYGDIVATDPS